MSSSWMQKHIFGYGKSKFWRGIDEGHRCLGYRWVLQAWYHARQVNRWLIDCSSAVAHLFGPLIDCLIDLFIYWIMSFPFLCAKYRSKKIQKKLKIRKSFTPFFQVNQATNQTGGHWALNQSSINHLLLLPMADCTSNFIDVPFIKFWVPVHESILFRCRPMSWVVQKHQTLRGPHNVILPKY